jgi:pimeloyl-ACP methyl ester carboxylesterase
MTLPHLKSVQCISPVGLHNMAYKEWGDPQNPNVLVCVHGLSRVSDDFDVMARELSDVYRVVCPDVVGRGRSSWLRDPRFYVLPQYVSDMVTLLARVNAETVDWFGTSMGGLIGMGIAALQDSPVRKLLLNDVGSVLNQEALKRIGEYLGKPVRFASFDEAAAYVRAISATFGPHTDEEWRKLAADVLRQDQDGQWILHYDAGIAVPIQAITPESTARDAALLAATYEAITCKTLLVRGAQSDLLSHDTAQAMTQRGPRASLVEIAGVGHAPTFVHAEQIVIAKDFFVG